MNDWAMRVARQEYSRLICEGMGIFLIAEAWGIEPVYLARQCVMDAEPVWRELPKRVQGRGLLTEPYLLGRMAEQIEQMYQDSEGVVVCLPEKSGNKRSLVQGQR